MQLAQPTEEKPTLLDRPVLAGFRLSWETLVFALVVILAIITRFYLLEPRVMSHDETSHVYFSWLLSKGSGYAHDPVTHGPLQFHLVALSYFLFGDSDTSARIPAVLFSIATVYFMWHYRRYLGRVGAIAAALFFTISPYMLYYGRYVRNEAFVALFGVMMLWAMLRYMHTGHSRYLYWFTLVNVLHFCTKETSFIYAAQALLFLAIYLIYRITGRPWISNQARTRFIIALLLALLLFSIAAILYFAGSGPAVPSATTSPATPAVSATAIPRAYPLSMLGLGLLAVVGAVYYALTGFGLAQLRQERSFDLAMLLGTLILPQLSPFLINAVGWSIPVNATEVRALTLTSILQIAAVLVPVVILSVVLGLVWNRRLWLGNAALWYSVFTVFYTTLFTNGAGFFTGTLGSLGYWLAQQEVNRGSQPLYYYALLQIPLYEFLPAIGSLLAIFLFLRDRQPALVEEPQPSQAEPSEAPLPNAEEPAPLPALQKPPFLALMGFWAITSLLAYSIAGEKMPWLTVHITLPMIILSGWTVGTLVDNVRWGFLRTARGWLMPAALLVFILALPAALRSLLGANPPFAGQSLDQLSATSEFLIALGAALLSGYALFRLLNEWPSMHIRHFIALGFLGFLAVLTARAAFMASYVNYDRATEYLVYAHSGPGDKLALAQIEDLSRRLTGGLDMVVAYDSDTTYPYWWYLRNYPNQRFYGSTPTRDLRDAPAILVGENNFGKIEPIVGQAYYRFDYIRIWWPNQDYFNLTRDRLLNAFRDPNLREAIFQIWLNRDYTKYGQVTGLDMGLDTWNPSGKMRLYLRKDVVSQLWDYGVGPSAAEVVADPYEGKQVNLTADLSYGVQGIDPGQFLNPRDVAVAPDGTIYVADTNNHRIQHLSADGQVLDVWGTFADLSKGAAPGGTFYEPWGVAVGPDGSVYVADTWNHRLQKFTADGQFLTMWGFFGQGETPFALWGPRDIAIDANGMVYVTDTGNKRVVVFDPQGGYITQFGTVGYDPGQFDEPTGLTVDPDGLVYVADTWNQRVQVFEPGEMGIFIPVRSWDVVAWFGQSLDNKPSIIADATGSIYLSDPEGSRILRFNAAGEFVSYWGDYGSELSTFILPSGLAADPAGGLWVADNGNHRILHFVP